jgi:hypothetical protein
MATVTFRDESMTGERTDEISLPGLPATMSARELVRLRVREEVARHNAAPAHLFRGLVRPDDAEAELNGYRLPERRRIDWERQADIAERAFHRNGYVMLAGGRQVEELDEIIDLTADPEIVFVKLTPLVGG